MLGRNDSIFCSYVSRYLDHMFFFSSRRRHTRFDCDWSSDVCSSDLGEKPTRRDPEMLAECVAEPVRPGPVPYQGHVDAPQQERQALAEMAENDLQPGRSEERRVGKEGRFRWLPYNLKKKAYMAVRRR